MATKRKYEETHPWIKFSIDITARTQMLWMLLGEAKSKCEHIGRAILEPDTSQQLHKVYLAKGVLATTAIEGNTLSEEEVMKQVEKTLDVPPSKQYLAQETQNIIDACNFILDEIINGRTPMLDITTIKEFNRRVLDKRTLEEGVVPGETRSQSVVVARYRGAPAEDCEHLLERLCDWLNSSTFTPPAEQPQLRLIFATLKAILAHLYIAWIHPFGDGNGRTARLIELLILVTSGVPVPAAQLLSNHYNLTRTEYYRQLDRSSRSGGDVLPFLTYAAQGFVDGLVGQLEYIHRQQWKLAWKNYVSSQLAGLSSEIRERCFHLVMAISDHKDPVPVPKLPEMNPQVAAFYTRKTAKTLSRDISLLMKKELIGMNQTGVRAKKETVLAFRPFVAQAKPQSA
jgi:Fic family protein